VALPGLLTPFPDPQASATLSLLGTHQLGTPPGTVTPTPAAPTDPMSATNAWVTGMNQNAYGTSDPAKLGLLGSAGFPLWNDPRLVQDHLAQLAQGTITAPGVTPQAAEDEFWRQMRGGNRGGGWAGGYGGGEGEMGSGGGGAGASGGGAGQDASGQW